MAKLEDVFPQAYARVVLCSFFRVKRRTGSAVHQTMLLYPPILKESIVGMKRCPDKDHKSVLVYISFPAGFCPGPEGGGHGVCSARPDVITHIFLPRGADRVGLAFSAKSNVLLYKQGDKGFGAVLASCSSIITTGGHTLLSEAMHLGIPAYVVPLPVYEQAMNAWVIDENDFGISRPAITASDLAYFLDNTDNFSRAIAADSTVLLRGDGRGPVIEFLESALTAA